MIEIDFTGNPFEDSKDIKDNFSIKPSEVDKVNNLTSAVYFDVKFNDINPFRKGDSVKLDMSKHERYKHIVNMKEDTVGRISSVFGHSIVNVSFESTVPATIKSVNISHLKLVNASFTRRVVNFLLNLSFVKKYMIKKINKKRIKK